MERLELILIFPTLEKKITILRSTQETSLMIGSLKTSTFFYHGGLEFHLGLRRHLAVTRNSASSQRPPTSSCKHSSVLTHASPALGCPLLPRGRQGVTVMSNNWTELPGAPATLVSGLCSFNQPGGRVWVTPQITGQMPTSAWSKFKSVIHLGLHRGKAKARMCRENRMNKKSINGTGTGWCCLLLRVTDRITHLLPLLFQAHAEPQVRVPGGSPGQQGLLGQDCPSSHFTRPLDSWSSFFRGGLGWVTGMDNFSSGPGW